MKSNEEIGIVGMGKAMYSLFRVAFEKNQLDKNNSWIKNNTSSDLTALKYGVQPANMEDVLKRKMCFLGIKPQQLSQFEGIEIPHNLISILAMTKLARLQEIFKVDGNVVRLMPMIASEFGSGYTGIYFDEKASKDFKKQIIEFCSWSGDYAVYNEEKKIEVHTIFTGSMLGIYAYLQEKFIEHNLKKTKPIWYIIEHFLTEILIGIKFSKKEAMSFNTNNLKGLKCMLKKYDPTTIQSLVASKKGVTETMINFLKNRETNVNRFVLDYDKYKQSFREMFEDMVQIGLKKAGY